MQAARGQLRQTIATIIETLWPDERTDQSFDGLLKISSNSLRDAMSKLGR